MSTTLKTSEEIKAAFEGLFANRTQQQQREDAAQLLSFRFLSEIERLMQEQGLTKRKLAELVGTSPSYITQLFRGDRLLNMDMLARIEQALEIQFVAGVEPSSIVATTKPNLKRRAQTGSSISAHRL